ncbi:DNA polymerase III subunit delta [secondary endosymbiont of Trabutina mannipara]|uniref:DNA polymerase III subunit delta n=1 Tax=secondary endosymbiont of Trabutina mannipara TaxID=1835721 RepID=A0A1C3L437_9ENTR|nr:DNA polymerase III subunit delta [secondary endosymbiont of Trabutina mannipara]
MYAEQLNLQLSKSLSTCYLLFGNEPLLLQESQDLICKIARKQQFDEYFSIMLDAHTDWYSIFSLCKERSLFSRRQVLLLLLPEESIKSDMGDNLLHLSSLLHDDLLLIIRGTNITSTLEKSAWFKELKSIAVLVICMTPEQTQLPQWVMKRANSMKLKLDNAACQLLCYCYEGNLPALVQVLEMLCLIYPDRNITFPRVEITVNDSSHFTIFNLVDAVLAGKSKRAIHILQQLQLEATDNTIIILLRSIQREIMLLLMLKRHTAASSRDMLKLWSKRKLLLNQAVERLTMLQLRNAIALAAKIEIAIKQDYKDYVWSDFNALILILCSKLMPEAMFSGSISRFQIKI